MIVVGPERLVLWIEVHADWIAQPDCINLSILTVAIHANNAAHPYFAVQIELLLRRHIVRLAELDIELVVRSDPANARGVIETFFRFGDKFTLWNHNASDGQTPENTGTSPQVTTVSAERE